MSTMRQGGMAYAPKFDRQLREAFKYFDWDVSGGIKVAELKGIFNQPWTPSGTGCIMNPEEVTAFFSKFDANQDGLLSFEEFLEGWRRTNGVDADKVLLEALRTAKKDKTFHPSVQHRSESSITGKITGVHNVTT